MAQKLLTQEEEETKMGLALGVWMKRNGSRVTDLRTRMGWSYNYSWMVARGKTSFKREAWGTFIAGFGIEAFAEVLRNAGLDKEINQKA